MPFKSVAHREHCRGMLERGEITPETFNKWSEGTPEELPERLGPKKEDASRSSRTPGQRTPSCTRTPGSKDPTPVPDHGPTGGKTGKTTPSGSEEA